jgi:hypothetical protein
MAEAVRSTRSGFARASPLSTGWQGSGAIPLLLPFRQRFGPKASGTA